MALKTDSMIFLTVSLLLQTTWAQRATPIDNINRLLSMWQQHSDPFSDSGQSDYNFADTFRSPFDNPAEPEPYYQNAATPLRGAQSDYYINSFPFAPFLAMDPNTISRYGMLPLDPDLLIFLSFCNLRPIRRPINCSPVPNQPSATPEGAPATSVPSTIPPPPASDQTPSPVSDSITSNPFSQTTPSSTARPPSTRAPATRPTTRQPATTQRASSAAGFTTERPNSITIRIGGPDEDAPATTTEEQYLPLDFAPVKPDREPSVTAPPVVHAPRRN